VAVNTGAEAIVHLVDDDDAVRDSLRTLLDSYGLDVREYKSAVQFLDEGDTTVGGCLVLDLHLPILSGLDLITIMRQRKIRLPVVFITGRSDKKIRERAMRAGAIAFLDKPLHEDSLMAAIHSALTEAPEPLGRHAAEADVGGKLSREGSAPA
jgi:two-component system, LuxR family, response regulator FixJ